MESVEKRIGVDATGARFNSIIAVEAVKTVAGTGAPEMNPLVNPGAISATSMVTGTTSDEVWKKIIGFHDDAAGRQLSVLQDVYKSESDSNQRNQAIGALMLAYGYIKGNWQQAVDLYTRQCSIGVNARDLATMAATLASRRQESGHRQTGRRRGKGPRRPRRDVHRRTVRRLRKVAVPHGPSGEERRWRRHHRRVARQVRHRRHLPAARRCRQQRAGAARHRRHLACARWQPIRSQKRRRPQAQPKPSLEIYGFAMLDIGHDFKQIDPNWFDTLRVTKLPSVEDEFGRDNNTFAGVRQSRLGVRSSTPTTLGDLKTTFEFELFGTGVDEGQTTFRLRHAYGELGAFGAGQTWSPFMDPDVFPNSLEYWGPTGMVFFRNVQVRWMPIKGDSNLTLALERPGRQRRAGRVRRPHRAAEHQGALPAAGLLRLPTSTGRNGATSGPPACSG